MKATQNTMLVVMLWNLAISSSIAQGEARSIRYASACGPCSAFAALRAMGIAVRLNDVARECGWQEGQQVTVEGIGKVFEKYPQLVVNYARIDLGALESHLDRGGVAIVLVSRNARQPNHAFCVIGQDNGALRIVDVPNIGGSISRAAFEEQWGGEAVLISPSARYRLCSEWPLLLLPAFAAVMATVTLWRLWQGRNNARKAKGDV
jgi:ABC-type bacteriocin/lantibiotic exporter with double-glycine peptidase domain